MKHLIIALFATCMAAQSSLAAQAESLPDAFRALLGEAELEFHRPDGFTDLPPSSTPVMDYEHALRSNDGMLEIRLAVRPIQRLQIDYDDPHGSTPDPNHIFPLVFESLASRLAGGRHAPSNPYPPDQARNRFNADWAAASVFDTVDDFGASHSQGLLVAIHRNRVADAYLVFLFDDYPAVKERLNQAMGTLVFAPQAEAAGTPASE